MKPLTPGTILEIHDLHRAAAAHALGFEVLIYDQSLSCSIPYEEYCLHLVDFDSAIIEITADGPNAFGNFLPQVGDLFFMGKNGTGLERGAVRIVNNNYKGLSCNELSPEFKNKGKRPQLKNWHGRNGLLALKVALKIYKNKEDSRIIERNGQPFPQFKIKKSS